MSCSCGNPVPTARVWAGCLPSNPQSDIVFMSLTGAPMLCNFNSNIVDHIATRCMQCTIMAACRGLGCINLCSAVCVGGKCSYQCCCCCWLLGKLKCCCFNLEMSNLTQAIDFAVFVHSLMCNLHGTCKLKLTCTQLADAHLACGRLLAVVRSHH